MPKTLHGKRLSVKEHQQWKKAHEGAKKSGARSPGAVATAAVKKSRAKRGRRK